MSAIFGIFYRDGRPVNPEELARMRAVLAHRGPDGSDVWHDGPAGLGHLMLRTTPESLNEQLPLLSRDGRLALTADARIDNRDELIAALNLRDRPAAQLADSALILAAYERWGERCVEHLLGDFAFAVWDRHEQKLFCARDHMGVKPFYYYYADRVFAFASEIKGLLALPQVPRQLNELRVAEYLACFVDDPETTFYEGIVRLPAAHRLRVARAQVQRQRYWWLDPSRELRLDSDAEYAEAFRATFNAAVRCRLRSTTLIGSSLSGGLDSSSIACTARDLLAAAGRPPLHTFSAIFPSLPAAELRRIDERPFIAAAVAMGGVHAHYLHADELSPLHDLAAIVRHGDGPVLGINLYIHWGMFGLARQQGVRVFLEGTDGDTTVSHGLGYLNELGRSLRLVRLLRETAALARSWRQPHRPWQSLWQHTLDPLLAQPARRIWERLGPVRPFARPDYSVISPDFAARVGLGERIAALTLLETLPERNLREAHWRSLQRPTIAGVLELADWAAAAFGLEPRYPFCDRRLVELCLALPPEQKLHAGMTRAVQRRAMAGTLPPLIAQRASKGDLSPNFRRQLLRRDYMLIEPLTRRLPESIAAYLDQTALAAAFARFVTRPTEAASEAIALYSAAMLAHGIEQLVTRITPSFSNARSPACTEHAQRAT